MEIKSYKTKVKPLQGYNPIRVRRQANGIFKMISSKTKRRPYIRSEYFTKEKVFLDYFWFHLQTKNWLDRTRRLRQYPCAIDLIKNSRIMPFSQTNIDKKSEILHRFSGINGNNEKFFVQIKEDKKSGEKHFMSVFPE